MGALFPIKLPPSVLLLQIAKFENILACRIYNISPNNWNTNEKDD